MCICRNCEGIDITGSLGRNCSKVLIFIHMETFNSMKLDLFGNQTQPQNSFQSKVTFYSRKGSEGHFVPSTPSLGGLTQCFFPGPHGVSWGRGRRCRRGPCPASAWCPGASIAREGVRAPDASPLRPWRSGADTTLLSLGFCFIELSYTVSYT